MSANIVNYKDFKIENLIIGAIEKKTSKKDQSAVYYQCTISYKYEKNVNNKIVYVIDELFLEFPEITSNGGITKKENQNEPGKFDASIFATFDISKEDVNDFVKQGSLLEPDERGVMGQIYFACLRAVYEGKSSVPSLARQQREDVIEGQFTPPIYWHMDSQGIIKGKNPSKFFPLVNYGQPGTFQRRETLFTAPYKDKNGKPVKIDWNCLEGVVMNFIPNVHFKKLFIGSKISLQMEIQSAVVTKLNKIGEQTAQDATINELLDANPNLEEEMQASIFAIKEMMNTTKSTSQTKDAEQGSNEKLTATSLEISSTELDIDISSLPGLSNLKK